MKTTKKVTTSVKKKVIKAVKFDYKTIKTFKDACKKLKIKPTNLPDVSMIQEDLRDFIIAVYKLSVIFKAINNGWTPDYSNRNQYKYYPYFLVLSSGFGFGSTYYNSDHTSTTVGSRLCTDSSEKALYISKFFEKEYTDFLLIKK